MPGNLIVAQSGGCTAVINSSLIGVVQEALVHPEIGEIYGARHGIVGVLNEDLIDLRRQPPDILERVRRTPSAALGSVRYKVVEADYERILAVFRAHNIRYFCYIGGNDSADTAHKVAQLAAAENYELSVISVPKTIDNDLPETDHCPGYGSIARFLAIASIDAGKDTQAMNRNDPIKLIEVMGRNAGWVAASATLGKQHPDDPPQLVYPPEIPLKIDDFLADIERVYRRVGWVVAVVSETVKNEEGQSIGALSGGQRYDPFGHRYFSGGTVAYLCERIQEKLGVRARFDKPGTIQRMSMLAVSDPDWEEAYRAGSAAVRHAVAGITDQMVTLVRESGPVYRITTGLAPLEKIANTERPMPRNFLTDDGHDTTQAYKDYALPLIGGREALPNYADLQDLPVPSQLPKWQEEG